LVLELSFSFALSGGKVRLGNIPKVRPHALHALESDARALKATVGAEETAVRSLELTRTQLRLGGGWWNRADTDKGKN